MKKLLLIPFLCLAVVSFFSFNSSEKTYPVQKIRTQYLSGLSSLAEETEKLNTIVKSNASEKKIKDQFMKVRQSYKAIEAIAVHFDPDFIKKFINGAPLPTLMKKVADMNILEPEGLQVLDELIFAEILDRSEIKKMVDIFSGQIAKMQKYHQSIYFTDRHVFEALRKQLVSIATLSITGFDTPGSAEGLSDSEHALKSMKRLLGNYQNYGEPSAEKIRIELVLKIDKAIAALEGGSFETFDRYSFIKNHVNPLYGQVLDYHLELDIETHYDVSIAQIPLNYMSRNLFAEDFLDASFYIDQRRDQDYSKQEELGKLLFFDPVLSSKGERACASCHDPKKAFTDGQKKSVALNFDGEVNRNSPVLINAVYADRFFWDLRASKLEDQIDHVVHNAKEFNTSFLVLNDKLRQSKEYVELFREAFPNAKEPINKYNVSFALASYVKTLTAMNSKFDQNMRDERDDLTQEEILGFNIFMGKGSCGTCHFAPTFAGLVPPFFKENETEVLGIPSTKDTVNAKIDEDPGRIASGILREAAPFYHRSFKTVTVRNVEFTAPYMHNGVYDNLDQVLHFYNVGGGAGFGIPEEDLENQTLPFDNLQLSRHELDALKAFMLTLSDTVGTNDIPKRLPVFEDASLNNRVIGGEY